jgi:hypothetical protein
MGGQVRLLAGKETSHLTAARRSVIPARLNGVSQPKVVSGPYSKAVGECIYCGSKAGLSREHVLPFGLRRKRRA